MDDDRVEYNYETGWPNNVVSGVLRSISAYTRQDRVRGFKIGITNDPERRFRDGYAHAYHKMAVVYQSESLENVSELERLLVEHNRELADNIISGGGGNYGDPPYYLYVAMR
ncbi:MAG: GIY-YIG nuclease family protein [Rubrivivax sp.]|nr:GIY-YIG nuclease family protein [Pyrinomonadaceae bacterium]